MVEALAGPDSTIYMYIFKSSALPYYLDVDCTGIKAQGWIKESRIFSGISEVFEIS